MTSATRTFKYNPVRGIIGVCVRAIIYFIGIFIMRKLVGVIWKVIAWEVDITDYETMVLDGMTLKQVQATAVWIYFGVAVIFLLSYVKSIYVNSCQRLIIKQDEIIYKSGWLTKCEIAIPANKIRSCLKHSSFWQRRFGLMNIGVVTAGDSPEFRFGDIEDGEEARRLILQLAKQNRKQRHQQYNNQYVNGDHYGGDQQYDQYSQYNQYDQCNDYTGNDETAYEYYDDDKEYNDEGYAEDDYSEEYDDQYDE